MSRFDNDINFQFNKIIDESSNILLIESNKQSLSRIFNNIYAINYLKNSAELKVFINTEYFSITYSCLIETFSLILNNYTRASSLVLRSAIENYIKHLIQIINNEYDCNYNIHDRRYSDNKSTLEMIILKEMKDCFKNDANSVNGRLDKNYNELSGLSHSLTENSRSNIIAYFNDITNKLDKVNINNIIIKLEETTFDIFMLLIIMCQPSFKHWVSTELESVLKIVFGVRKTKTYIENLKDDSTSNEVAVTSK